MASPTRIPAQREHTGNVAIDRVQAQAQKAAQTLNLLPFANGVWVRNVDITAAADVTVNHGLGRVPQGYLVTRLRGGGVVSESAAANQPPDTTKRYAFTASANVTVDLWIF